MENILTTEAAAMIIGVSQARIRKLIKEGRLPAEKIGRDLLLKETDVKWFAENGRKKVGRPQKKVARAQ
jgi:excisionase family DNA binding protein